MKTIDCFCSGVSIEVTDDVDPNTDQGYETIKWLAAKKMIAMLSSTGFDIDWEIYDNG